MKKSLLIVVALLTTFAVKAQQIAVVSSDGNTTLYQDLNEAITDASSGSVIYLPGGGFQLKDETKITKNLTIIGVSHRVDADNADGATIIGGNLWFNKGSNGSSVMGVYLSGDVNIGEDEAVSNILVRTCNINSVQVKQEKCNGIAVNQCYIRNNSSFANNNAKITNCVLPHLQFINGGIIDHNVVTSNFTYRYANGNSTYATVCFASTNNAIITNNILISPSAVLYGSNCLASNNMLIGNWGDDCVTVEDWAEVLGDISKGISPASDFSLQGEKGKGAATDGTDIGIYGGTSFDKYALAPIPRIVSKVIPEQTDAQGKLKITVTVKAN